MEESSWTKYLGQSVVFHISELLIEHDIMSKK